MICVKCGRRFPDNKICEVCCECENCCSCWGEKEECDICGETLTATRLAIEKKFLNPEHKKEHIEVCFCDTVDRILEAVEQLKKKKIGKNFVAKIEGKELYVFYKKDFDEVFGTEVGGKK